jgi:hypothetical protein
MELELPNSQCVHPACHIVGRLKGSGCIEQGAPVFTANLGSSDEKKNWKNWATSSGQEEHPTIDADRSGLIGICTSPDLKRAHFT